MFLILLLGALLSAAPATSRIPVASDPRIVKGEFQWLAVGDTKEEIAHKLGRPAVVADFAKDFESWQYQIGEVDHDSFSHQIVFRKSTGRLISATRQYDPEQLVDEFFPVAKTSVEYYPDSKKPQYSMRLRRMPDGGVLMAMGTSKPGQKTQQLVLMSEAELRIFYPWLFERLSASKH